MFKDWRFKHAFDIDYENEEETSKAAIKEISSSIKHYIKALKTLDTHVDSGEQQDIADI
jgi:hypothetical protein